MKDGRVITKDTDVAESFCEFFADIGPDLAGKVPSPDCGSFWDYLGQWLD